MVLCKRGEVEQAQRGETRRHRIVLGTTHQEGLDAAAGDHRRVVLVNRRHIGQEARSLATQTVVGVVEVL